MGHVGFDQQLVYQRIARFRNCLDQVSSRPVIPLAQMFKLPVLVFKSVFL